LIGLAALIAGCGKSAHPSQTLPVPSSPAASATSSPNQADLKPMIHGLIDRGGPPPAGFSGAVTAFVADANWSDLQPTPFGPLAANNVIDQAITTARQIGGGMAVKIRLYAGLSAPSWVKALSGGPVSVYSPADHTTGTIGRFWTSDFGKAYDDLWSKLAAAYDAVPEIREITASRCMTVFAETFIRDTSDATTVSNLLAAGFSSTADQACITQEIDAGKVWRHTRIGVAFNPYQAILPGGGTGVDEVFTETMMQLCRTDLGAQCVLENNSIRWPPLGGAYAQMYAAMQRLGAPVSFQTAAAARVGDLAQTLSWAVSVGADAVELPSGYQSQPVQVLQPFTKSLQQNPG
jgi:hypothetical protein